MKESKWFSTLVIITAPIIALFLIFIGIQMEVNLFNSKEHQAMVKTINQHKIDVDTYIKEQDPEDKIDNVTLDFTTVKIFPLGKATLSGYVNGNKNLSFEMTVEKKQRKFKVQKSTLSPQLRKYLQLAH